MLSRIRTAALSILLLINLSLAAGTGAGMGTLLVSKVREETHESPCSSEHVLVQL